MNKFREWLYGRFLEFEKSQGSRQSYASFARYLEITPPSLSQYLKGDFIPSGENVRKIAKRYPDIYSVVDFGSQFPPELLEAIQSGVNKATEAGFSLNTPEATRLIIDALIDFREATILTNMPSSNSKQ